MDHLDQIIFEAAFLRRFLLAKGNAFEDFFADIMEMRYPKGDFVRVYASGQLGDLKNDGYLKSEGKIFQCYAPHAMTARAAVAKIETDLTGAVKHWGEHFDEWIFVHNDIRGVHPPFLDKILEMNKRCPFRITHWGFNDLRSLAQMLSAKDRVALLPVTALTELARARCHDNQIYMWTAEDFRAGLEPLAQDTMVEVVEANEPIDVAVLRQRRLPRLQIDYQRVADRAQEWLQRGASAKRGGQRLRVFWIEAEKGPARSSALLASLSRACWTERSVLDAASDPGLAAIAVDKSILVFESEVPPAVGVDLDTSDNDWSELKNILTQARKRFDGSAEDPYPRLIIAGMADQAQSFYDTMPGLVEIAVLDLRGRDHQRPYSFHGANTMESASVGRGDVFNRGLPMTSRALFGRQDELARLDNAWGSKQMQVVPVVSSGGMGKSALVNHWLEQMREDDYRGARKVFVWSFYSQGTKDNLVAADPFINAALEWMGDDSPRGLNPWTKGLRLGELIRQHKMLLILDGMEPLQHPLTDPAVGGQLKDDSVRALLESLSNPGWDGSCVVTTRVEITDLRYRMNRPIQDCTVHEIVLDVLDDRASSELLSYLGVRGSFRDKQSAVQEFGGHALAITLLGNYLRNIHGGDLAGRFDIDKLMPADAQEGGHARRVMAAYSSWLGNTEGRPALAVLRMIGLFDRPARPQAMQALLGDETIDHYAEHLDEVGGEVWNECVTTLRKMGLLNEIDPAYEPGTLDAHPLVREHFQCEIRETKTDLWLRGNQRLYDYYRNEAPEQPENSEGMTALYAAVTHGTAAGLHQKVFDEVLLPRVWRDRRTNFATRRLGMTGSDLVALSNYFVLPSWTTLKEVGLAEGARVLIRTNAGVRLRQLGRLADARECFSSVAGEAAITKTIGEADPSSLTDKQRERLQDASYAAAQYCELLVIAGNLGGSDSDSALINADRAINFADGGGDPYFRMHARSSLAEVHFMLGEFEKAGELFEEALAIDRADSPRPPFHYSQSLFRWAYFLIETDQSERILALSEKVSDWGKNGKDSSLLSEAIRLLAIGAAHRSRIERKDESVVCLAKTAAQGQKILDDSVSGFWTAGYADYVVRGLLERAHFWRVRNAPDDHARVRADLERATIEARRGQMHLLYCDILLQWTAAQLKVWPIATQEERIRISGDVADTLREASALVKSICYDRRRPMLVELQQLASSFGIPWDTEAQSQ